MMEVEHYELTFNEGRALLTFDRRQPAAADDVEIVLRLAPAAGKMRIDGVGMPIVFSGLLPKEVEVLTDGREVFAIEADPQSGEKTAYKIDRVAVIEG